MNRGLNLPQIQRIMNEFERESATMDMKEEMMSDAVDDVMDDDLEDEEEEGDKILKQVLDEIGVGISQQVRVCLSGFDSTPPPPPHRASIMIVSSSPTRLRASLPPRRWLNASPSPLLMVLLHRQRTTQVLVVLVLVVVARTKMPYKLAWMPFAEGRQLLMKPFPPASTTVLPLTVSLICVIPLVQYY